MIQNSSAAADKIQTSRKGFTLIELLVAMFIFAIVMGGMVAVSVAGFRSYGKSKAVKTVTEDVGFAINSIAKDVRMGKIETSSDATPPSKQLIVTRNSSQEKVCYKITDDYKQLHVIEKSTNLCTLDVGGRDNAIVDLSSTSMIFDGTSGFRSQITDTTSATKIRGWAEINLNIESPTMETDSISVQTIVSSRDYGWEDVP